MTIGITGANGHLGRLVIGKLKAKAPAANMVALARTPAKAADLGVQVREADYNKPDTLERALTGIDALLLISSSEVGKRIKQHGNVIQAAKKAGVKHIVYTSLLHADTSPITMLAEEHGGTEAALKASGIPFTILRNSWYTENYTASIPAVVSRGAVLGCAGEAKISSAPRADYAEAAVAVLTTPGHEGKIYELAGDRAFTLSELAAEISRQTGKTIPYKNLSEAEYAAALVSSGLPAEAGQMIASLDTKVSQGALFDEGRQLSKLIGRPTTPLAVAVADALR
jgi:NAD(P)H dehydrogenase (quinone)